MGRQIEETKRVDPTLTPGDILHLKGQEEILLKVAVTSLTLSALGKVGGSRNLNMSIMHITAVSGQGNQIVEIGSIGEEAPVCEVDLARPLSTSNLSVVQQALTVSFIDENNSNFLQCDAATIWGSIDPLALNKVLAFPSKCTVLCPQPLLPMSPSEDARLFILQQSDSHITLLNCSVRLHGYTIVFPLESTENLIGRDNVALAVPLDSQTWHGKKETITVSCNIIEFYSGSAAEELFSVMDSKCVCVQDGTMSALTRQLHMLNIFNLPVGIKSPLTSHWVCNKILLLKKYSSIFSYNFLFLDLRSPQQVVSILV